MNKDRRKDIEKANNLISVALDNLAQAKEIIEQSRDDEQDYFDNMPESLQGGEKGASAERAIEKLEAAISAIEDFEVSEVVEVLEEASE